MQKTMNLKSKHQDLSSTIKQLEEQVANLNTDKFLKITLEGYIRDAKISNRKRYTAETRVLLAKIRADLEGKI